MPGKWYRGRHLSATSRRSLAAHIWTRPGFARESRSSVLRKDCVHISGLEVEGRHPRALMESALLYRHQVNGLKRPSRHIWARPGFARESRSSVLRKDCVHISGLEVEG